MEIITSDNRIFYLENKNKGDFKIEFISCEDKVSIYKISLDFNTPKKVVPIKIKWNEKMLGILSVWSPMAGRMRNIPQWFKPQVNISDFYGGAPIISFVNQNNKNYATASISECEYFVKLEAYVNDFEEKENLDFVCTLFEGNETISSYNTYIRIDENIEKPFYQTIKEAGRWWQNFYKNNETYSKDAELPLYSSWYNFHQHPNSFLMEKELKIAKELGFGTVIIDDGWSYDGMGTGDYYDCGDWKIAKSKFPDFKEFVSFAHKLNMKVALWFPVPFVGYNNKDFPLLKDKMLYLSDKFRAGILDPRYPEVRDYILESYKKIVYENNLDGLKLDFIDSFICEDKTLSGKNCGGASGKDFDEVKDGVKKLLESINCTFKQNNKEFLIEFRQSYIGASIIRYCNMLRVLDCAFDSGINRMSVADLRLFDYNLAVHSDMLYWSKDESKENCAIQLLSIMFSVPQISVLLTESTDEQIGVVKNFLDYWTNNKEIILHGEFKAYNPEYNYTRLSSENEIKNITVLYLDNTYKYDGKQTDLFNASNNNEIIIENISDNSAKISVYDCLGKNVNNYKILPQSIVKINVLPACKITINNK